MKYVGRTWVSLKESEREKLLHSAYVVSGNGEKLNDGNECIVDFVREISISGRIVDNENETTVEIDDDAVFYSPSWLVF